MTSGLSNEESGTLPVAQDFDPGLAREAEGDRNIVFGSLVTGDNDIVGLVAYSIYKQNKHDWLVAFSRARGRDPRDEELQSYIIGESTPRRLATYRHLAQATLEGHGPDVTAAPSADAQRSYSLARRSRPGPAASNPTTRMIAYAVIALVVVILIFLAARFGLPGVGPARP